MTLGDIGEISTSSVDKKISSSEKPVRLVNYMDVYRYRFITNQMELMQVTASRGELAKSQLRVGDVLFTPSSETPDDVGHSAVVLDDMPDTLHSYHTVRLRPTTLDNVHLRFLGRFANTASVLKHFERNATGSTRYTLSLSDFRSAPIHLPPVAEQLVISGILDSLDSAICQTEAIIEKLKQARQGLLHDLLTRGIDPNGELRPPQSEAPQVYKQSPLGWIPENWQVHKFGDVVGHLMDYRGRTPKKLGMAWGGGDILALSANNVQMGAIDPSREAYYGSERLYARWMTNGDPERGDVLLTLEAPLGNVAQIPDSRRYILSQRVILIRFDSTLIENDFAYWQLMSEPFQRQMAKRSTGTTATGIQRAQLFHTLLVAPPIPEQRAIAARLRANDAWLGSERATRTKLLQQKVGLTNDLLSGRVRVTPLLEKVAAAT